EPETKGAGWVQEITAFLDEQLGKVPETFTYGGKTYTPKTFAKEVIGINPADYMEFSSYKDTPYYEKMDLPEPDNWSYDMVQKVAMTVINVIIGNALAKGFTVEWSPYVSEK